MKKRIAVLILAILLSLLGSGVAQAAPGTKYIRDDATGGDCTMIGNWDFATKTCTLKMNLTDSIWIVSQGITLDGHGHRLSGSSKDFGIYIAWVGGVVTIKNVRVSSFDTGIHSTGPVQEVSITDDILQDNNTGIRLAYASGNISRNTVSNNRVGFEMYRPGLRTVSDNLISNNKLAVYLNDDSRSVFTNNTFTKNETLIQISDHAEAEFYNNNFINNGRPLVAPGGYWGGAFNRPAPLGGNYWSDNHTPAQGCEDVNKDGFCDAPYVLRAGGPLEPAIQDNLPWTHKSGWLRSH